MQKVSVHIAAIITMVFWGFSFILSKIVFEFYTPLTTVFLRLLISTFFLLLVIIIARKFERIHPHDIWLFIAGAFFNPFLYFIGENFGLERVSASISAIIISTIPVFTPFVAFKIFREKLTAINIIGLIISFLGLMLILFNWQFQIYASLTGIALLFLAVFSAVVYTVFLKKLSFKYNPITIIIWQNFIGLIFFLPLFIIYDYKEMINIIPDRATIISLLSLGILCSSLAFVLFTYSIKHLGISKSNLYTNLIPVIASVAAFFILKEGFTFQKIAGIGIVVFGVLLSQLSLSGKLFKRK